MTRSARIRQSIAALTGAAIVALVSHTVGAQEPPDDSSTAPPDTTAPETTVPNDTGIVHSWAIAPGDGTQAAGQRPNLSYELPPGGSVDDFVTLFNFSNVPLTFAVYATDAFNNDDGSFNLLAGAEEPTDVGSWVTLPIDAVTVPAGKQASFPISIHVPVDARPGDHVGAVLASSTAFGTGPENAVITLDRRTGTRLYVRVAGELHPELGVENLETSYAAAANPVGGSAEVSYTIANRGNVRLAGTHQVSVAGPFGLLRASLEEEAIPELLPGESMEVTRTIDDAPATGVLIADVDVQPESPAGGDELEPSGSSSSMVALPYTLLALVLILILGTFAYRAYKRHRNATPDVELIEPPAGEVLDADVVEHQKL
jgi:hypothetical protein